MRRITFFILSLLLAGCGGTDFVDGTPLRVPRTPLTPKEDRYVVSLLTLFYGKRASRVVWSRTLPPRLSASH